MNFYHFPSFFISYSIICLPSSSIFFLYSEYFTKIVIQSHIWMDWEYALNAENVIISKYMGAWESYFFFTCTCQRNEAWIISIRIFYTCICWPISHITNKLSRNIPLNIFETLYDTCDVSSSSQHIFPCNSSLFALLTE